jgi:FdhE protein
MSTESSPYALALSQLRQLKEKDPELGPILTCFEQILSVQQGLLGRFKPDVSKLTASYCGKRNSEGLPCLSSARVSVPVDLLNEAAKRVSAATNGAAGAEEPVKEWPGLSEEAVTGLVSGVLEGTGSLATLAAEADYPTASFAFVAFHSVAPFVEAYAAELGEHVDLAAWDRGTCPVCGGQPLMGRLEKDTGKRHLQCSLCTTEWPFGRLECPFCGTEEQEKLRYFFDEDDKSVRVEVCDACKSYIKTVDARLVEEPRVALVEHLAALHLDLVAGREGFHRDVNRFYGL